MIKTLWTVLVKRGGQDRSPLGGFAVFQLFLINRRKVLAKSSFRVNLSIS